MSNKVCPWCKKYSELIDVRGESLCVHCQLNRIWDYVEENRRRIEGDVKKKEKAEYDDKMSREIRVPHF